MTGQITVILTKRLLFPGCRYVDDHLVYEVDQIALRAQTNAAGEQGWAWRALVPCSVLVCWMVCLGNAGYARPPPTT